MPRYNSTGIKGTFITTNRRRPMKMEDRMAKLFSCNTPRSMPKVKSEDTDTAKTTPTKTTTSTRKRPRVTTPTVIVIEDDDDLTDQQQQQQQQWSALSLFTLGSNQELQLVVEGTAVSIYTKIKSKKYLTLTDKQWMRPISCWKHIDEKMKTYIRKAQVNITTRNAWQRLAYSPLGAIVSPPSKYLWKTLTYWSPECLTAPFHSEHRK